MPLLDVSQYEFPDELQAKQGWLNYGNALRQSQSQRAAGNALASGDTKGAVSALYTGGQIGAGQALEQNAQAQQQAKQAAAAQATQSVISRVSDVYRDPRNTDPQTAKQRALQTYDYLAPQLIQHGESQQEIAQARQLIEQDPEAGLLTLGAGAAKEAGYEIRNAGDEVLVINPKTGQLVNRLRGAKTATIGQGGSLYEIPGSGGSAPAGSASPPVSGAPPAQPTATAGTPPQVNPDAVWQSIKTQESGGLASPGTAVGPDTRYGNAYGSTQMLPATAEAMARKLGIPWNPALMRENSPKALAYQDKLGRAYFDEGLEKSGGDPAAAAAYYFAGPDPAQHGPKTAAYVQQVMGRAGGSVQQPLEGGAGADTLEGKPRLLVTNPKPSTENSAVDPNIVKGLIEGRIAPPTQKAAATPYWQAQLQAAAEQDPTFDMVNFQARGKTRSDFTSGKSAQNITALNTVIGHLDHLDRTIDELGNTGPGGGANFGPLNSLNNSAARILANASGTDARYKNFETAKTAVANELTRVFRGTGGAEADIQGWMKQLDGAGSPEALHKVVQSMAELINSRIEALGEQYQQGMGTTKDPITLLTPDKQKSFQRMMGGATPTAQGRGGGANAAALQQARDAIRRGADRNAVIQRLRQHNIDPQGL